jgi:hypothetical protein
MATLQEKIRNRIFSLNELEDVKVESTNGYGQISISHRLHHTADFKLKWVDQNHYVGYFIEAYGNESQAIVSIWSTMEAIKFVVLYSSLIELKARR